MKYLISSILFLVLVGLSGCGMESQFGSKTRFGSRTGHSTSDELPPLKKAELPEEEAINHFNQFSLEQKLKGSALIRKRWQDAQDELQQNSYRKAVIGNMYKTVADDKTGIRIATVQLWTMLFALTVPKADFDKRAEVFYQKVLSQTDSAIANMTSDLHYLANLSPQELAQKMQDPEFRKRRGLLESLYKLEPKENSLETLFLSPEWGLFSSQEFKAEMPALIRPKLSNKEALEAFEKGIKLDEKEFREIKNTHPKYAEGLAKVAKEFSKEGAETQAKKILVGTLLAILSQKEAGTHRLLVYLWLVAYGQGQSLQEFERREKILVAKVLRNDDLNATLIAVHLLGNIESANSNSEQKKDLDKLFLMEK